MQLTSAAETPSTTATASRGVLPPELSDIVRGNEPTDAEDERGGAAGLLGDNRCVGVCVCPGV